MPDQLTLSRELRFARLGYRLAEDADVVLTQALRYVTEDVHDE